MMNKTKNVYFISHTHWDREWYMTRESSRLMLIDLIDRLLDILDTDPKYKAFMLDGQAIVLEDYLKIRPENQKKLKKYIKEGRVLIGPWYVLPDELLISGEAHIRNYLLGDDACKKLGGKMNLGYLPDSFGHPSQMPQLIKGLGMNELIFWRGVGPEVNKSEFNWIGLDGSEIYAINMPFGYGLGACLPADKEHFVRRIKQQVEKLENVTDGDIVLYMNGVDHVAPDAMIPKMLEDTKGDFDFNIIHTTLPEYVKALRKQNLKMENYQGELRSPKRAYLLGGTISTRMYLKQENFAAEQLIEKYIEPLASICYINGNNYPAGELKQLWEYTLSNLPHDSICGCSIDDVHKEMMMRYKWIKELGNGLYNKLNNYITGSIKADSKGHEGVIVVFNTLEHARHDIVHAVLDVRPQLIRRVNFDTGILTDSKLDENRKLPTGIKLFDVNDNEVFCKLDKSEKEVKMKLSLDDQPHMYEVMKLNVSFLSDKIPALGYKVYRYDLEFEENETGEVLTKDFIMENEYFKVTPDKNTGTLEILDKMNSKVYHNCNLFLDNGDAGDEYTYSPPIYDEVRKIKEDSIKINWLENNELRQSLKIEGVMELPISVTEDRKHRSTETTACPIESIITIYSKIKRIDISTQFENKVNDHLLKVVFPTGMRAAVSNSEGIFSVDKHNVSDIHDKTDYSDWIEVPCGTNSQKTFVDVSNEELGITIANRGITESTVYDDGNQTCISLTLLRSVGWLSRKDLLLRKGNAGWTLPTPDAQCLGKYTFEYSIIPHEGDWSNGQSYTESHNFAAPLQASLKSEGSGILPETFSYIEIEAPEITLSAVKKAETRDDLVIRIYNESSKNINTSLRLNFDIKEVFESTMSEIKTNKLKVSNGKVNLGFKPWQIITLCISLKRRKQDEFKR